MKDHIGYVANILETVDKNGSVITDYAYEQNIYSDSHFLQDYLAKQPIHDETKTTLVTDGTYGGEHNLSEAAKHGIRLSPTNFITSKPSAIYGEFKFSEDGKSILKCGNSKTPISTYYNPSSGICLLLNKNGIASTPLLKCANVLNTSISIYFAITTLIKYLHMERNKHVYILVLK